MREPPVDSSRRPRLSRPFAIAVLAALAIATLLPGEAHAASGITDTATTTYEVLPDLGIVRVAIDLRIQNRISSKVQRSTCTQSAVDPYFGSYTYTTTCTRTTRYYVNWTSTWI